MKKIKRRSLLYKSGVEYADFCLNHVEGCALGWRFPCYAWQMAKRFGKVKRDSDWLEPKLVENSIELLDTELPKYKSEIKFVHMCFMTDPFMNGFPEVSEMSLRIINKLNSYGIRCTTLTKGVYPRALTDKVKYGGKNEYGITLVSLNPDFKKQFEPFSVPYAERIKSLKYLHAHGLKTWASLEPFPTPNLDTKSNLKKLLNSVKFVNRIIFGKLNYNVVSRAFLNNDSFYEESARQVIDFCKRNKIDCHIKFGTQKHYNKKTASLFTHSKEKQMMLTT